LLEIFNITKKDMKTPTQLELIRSLCVKIDAIIQAAQTLDKNREVALVITKLEEAKMWAGKNCGNYEED
jgi:hypothetical protein